MEDEQKTDLEARTNNQRHNKKDVWFLKTADDGTLKVRWARMASAVVGVSVLGSFVAVGLGSILLPQYHKEEYTPLTERLESAYQQCQTIEDKNQEVRFASFAYSTCREVEDLYLKVNPK